jgi:hypothetical protein
MVCMYEHHKEYGQELICRTCHGAISCGPFHHGCRTCQPDKFHRCLLCRVERLFCCC